MAPARRALQQRGSRKNKNRTPTAAPVPPGTSRSRDPNNMARTPPLTAAARAVSAFAGDVADGAFAILHNGLILVGAAVVAAALVLLGNPDLRNTGEQHLSHWLTAREMAETGIKPDFAAIARATAINPHGLEPAQANVANWISKKYRVAPEPVAALVHEAFRAGELNNLEPTLILAVAAIESSFNPFAQSHAGAQGLMQVMTHVHSDKYAYFGGDYAAFDPKSNLRVGVRILREYIERAGSLQDGLKWYVGAAKLGHDGGYAAKVVAEYRRMYEVAYGRPLSGKARLRAEYRGPAPESGATQVALVP